MSNIQLIYSSWCNEKGSDKVWGYFYVGESHDSHLYSGTPVFVFYGARGKALQLKQHETGGALLTLKRSKESKGYRQVMDSQFLELCPNFYQEVDDKLTFTILAGNRYKSA